MNIPLRKSVQILLLNAQNELLLMCADDPSTKDPSGIYHGPFWFPVGGKIEEGESVEGAAWRELFEETGLTAQEVALGPIVWYGTFDLILSGTLQRLHQQFLVAHTTKTTLSNAHFTAEERAVIIDMAWFSLDQIKTSTQPIFPVILPDYLPSILTGNYPSEPLLVDLSKQPKPAPSSF